MGPENDLKEIAEHWLKLLSLYQEMGVSVINSVGSNKSLVLFQTGTIGGTEEKED